MIASGSSRDGVSPGQLYSTVSGHLYHAGKVCIIMVGLPARGKTHRAVAITRYLRWLGVKVQVFHLGNYRRRIAGIDFRISDEYFAPNSTNSDMKQLRELILTECLGDMWSFYGDGGQVAVFDAINATVDNRMEMYRRCKSRGVECLFVESLVTDEKVLARNISDVRDTSPDYVGRDPQDSLEHYLRNLEKRISIYQPMTREREHELVFIKLVNDGEKCVVNNGPLGYLLNRVLMFLLNSRRRRGSLFFARAGATGVPNETYKDDNDLCERGLQYSATLTNTLLGYVSAKQLDLNEYNVDMTQIRRIADQSSARNLGSTNISADPSHAPSLSASRSGSVVGTPTDPPLKVWTSTRIKTVQTSLPFHNTGVPTSHRSLLNQLNPGDAAGLTDAELKEKWPEEYEAFTKSPYHHRWPRGESYQDVAIRLEPVMMEMERVQSSLLIIAHESVLRVLYGYAMGLSVQDIPFLRFPANQIVEVVPMGYSNSVVRIPLAGVSIDGGVDPVVISRSGSVVSL